MTIPWHVPEDDAISTVATARATGVTSLALVDASKFGTAGWPKLVVIRRGTPPSDVTIVVLEFTGRTGNTLTGVAPSAGYADAAVNVGDVAFLGATKLHITEIQSAIDTLALGTKPPAGTVAGALQYLNSGTFGADDRFVHTNNGTTTALVQGIDDIHKTSLAVTVAGPTRIATFGSAVGVSHSVSGPTGGVVVPRNTAWEVPAWSWSYWVKIPAGTFLLKQGILSTSLLGNGTTSGVCTEVYSDTIYMTVNSFQSSVVGPGSQWRHVVFTFDSTNFKIYLDNTLVTTAGAGAMVWGTNDLLIGGFSDPNCLIKDVRIYNRKLPLSDVTILYNGGELPSGLLFNWRCNEGTGNVLTDSVAGLVGTSATALTWSTDVPSNNPGSPSGGIQDTIVWKATAGTGGVNGVLDIGDPAGRVNLQAATTTVGALTGLIKGATGVLSAAAEGTDYLNGASARLPVHLSFTGTGTPTIATDVTPWSFVSFGSTGVRLTLTCKTAPTGNFQVTIKRSADNGATFPDIVATITVTSGTKIATTTTFSNATLAAGNVLRCDIISVNGAADWTARLDVLSKNQ